MATAKGARYTALNQEKLQLAFSGPQLGRARQETQKEPGKHLGDAAP
jgi:hypothetical protein